MKTTARFIALALAGLTLVSCGSSGGEGGETTASSDTTTAEVTTAPAEYQKPDVNYSGEKITFMQTITPVINWQASTYHDVLCEEENGDPINDAQYKRNTTVEELLGVEFEIFYNRPETNNESTGAFISKQIMAGDHFADVVFCNGGGYKTLLATDGMLIDLNDVTTLNMEGSWWDDKATEEFTFGGQTKAITGDLNLGSNYAVELIFFNKTVSDQLKITDLYDLVRSGDWTLSKLSEYSKLAAADVNGDSVMGKEDRYGFSHQPSNMNNMLISCGSRYTKREDGELKLAINSENTISAVEFLVPFMNDSSVSLNVQKHREGFGNVFREFQLPMFAADQTLFLYQQLVIAFELRAMDSDYGLLPFPKLDSEQDSYYTPTSSTWFKLTSVPATAPVEHYDMIGDVLNALGYYSQQLVTPAYIDTTVRTKSLRDDDSAEMLDLIFDSIVYDISMIYNWNNLYSFTSSLCSNQDTNFASAYASREKTILTEMQTTLEQLEG